MNDSSTRHNSGLAIAAALLLAPSLASADVITFEGSDDATCVLASNCFNGSAITPTYGSRPGLDVSYDGDINTAASDMYWWDANYGSTRGVAYGQLSTSGSGGGAAQVTLLVTTGYSLQLNSFLISPYTTSENVLVKVFDLANPSTPIFDNTGSTTIPFPDGTLFSLTNAVSSQGFAIQFGPDGYYAAIDNIDFTLTPVPLPAAAWLLLSGMGGLAAVARRRRARA